MNQANITNNSNLPYGPFNYFTNGNVKINHTKFIHENLNKIKSSLLSCRFTKPSEKQFRENVFEIFKLDINKYNDILALNYSSSPEVAIKSCKLIYIEDAASENPFNDELICYINKLFFDCDKLTLTVLKGRYPSVLEYLVFEYGYSSNYNVIEFVLLNIDFNDEILVHRLLFGNPSLERQIVLRKNIIDKINLIIYKRKYADGFDRPVEGSAYKSITSIIDLMLQHPTNYQILHNDIAFLLNETLKYGIVGDVQSCYKNYPDLMMQISRNNFYDCNELKLYANYLHN